MESGRDVFAIVNKLQEKIIEEFETSVRVAGRGLEQGTLLNAEVREKVLAYKAQLKKCRGLASQYSWKSQKAIWLS